MYQELEGLRKVRPGQPQQFRLEKPKVSAGQEGTPCVVPHPKLLFGGIRQLKLVSLFVDLFFRV